MDIANKINSEPNKLIFVKKNTLEDNYSDKDINYLKLSHSPFLNTSSLEIGKLLYLTVEPKADEVTSAASDCVESEGMRKNTSNDKIDSNKNSSMKEELRGIVKEASNFKKEGNDYFHQQKIELAIEYYNKSLISLNKTAGFKELLSQTNIDSIKTECLNNLAICYIMKKEYDKVLSYTQLVLKIQKRNYKALYIRSRALKKLNRLEEALEYIKLVSKYM